MVDLLKCRLQSFNIEEIIIICFCYANCIETILNNILTVFHSNRASKIRKEEVDEEEDDNNETNESEKDGKTKELDSLVEKENDVKPPPEVVPVSATQLQSNYYVCL